MSWQDELKLTRMASAPEKTSTGGGTRKIADFEQPQQCKDPNHDPPNMQVLEPGMYEHTCPSCGQVQYFTISPKPSM